jgi:hypothetical protein
MERALLAKCLIAGSSYGFTFKRFPLSWPWQRPWDLDTEHGAEHLPPLVDGAVYTVDIDRVEVWVRDWSVVRKDNH